MNPLMYEREVLDMTGWKKSTIQEKMRTGKFPRKLFWSPVHGLVWSRKDILELWEGKKELDSGTRGFVNV